MYLKAKNIKILLAAACCRHPEWEHDTDLQPHTSEMTWGSLVLGILGDLSVEVTPCAGREC